MNLMRRLWNDEEGQGMVEYGLIIALVAVVLIVVLNGLTDGLTNIFNRVTGELTDPGVSGTGD
jgi:pilus assembly protein Flp/PilA